MPNSFNNSGNRENPRPERGSSSNTGINRADLWGKSDAPPEENELHVLELLQRLETETANPPSRLQETPRQQPTKWAQWEPEVTCSVCSYLNSADQRFCGHCGSVLQRRENVAAEPPLRPALRAEELHQSRPLDTPRIVLDEKPATDAPIFSRMSGEARERNDSDLEFLRYKTLGASEPSSGWKTPLVLLVLAIAGFVGFRLYNGWSIVPSSVSSVVSRPAPASTPQTPSAEPASDSSAAVTSPDPQAEAPPLRQPEATPAPSVAAKPRQPLPTYREDRQPITEASQRNRETGAPPVTSAASAGGAAGREELAQAERYLSPSTRNSSEAAKWLWRAVGKENGRAVILLSNLYASGDGVAKSCDQARLLLTVAAKKGNTEAGSRLRSLESCK